MSVVVAANTCKRNEMLVVYADGSDTGNRFIAMLPVGILVPVREAASVVCCLEVAVVLELVIDGSTATVAPAAAVGSRKNGIREATISAVDPMTIPLGKLEAPLGQAAVGVPQVPTEPPLPQHRNPFRLEIDVAAGAEVLFWATNSLKQKRM